LIFYKEINLQKLLHIISSSLSYPSHKVKPRPWRSSPWPWPQSLVPSLVECWCGCLSGARRCRLVYDANWCRCRSLSRCGVSLYLCVVMLIVVWCVWLSVCGHVDRGGCVSLSLCGDVDCGVACLCVSSSLVMLSTVCHSTTLASANAAAVKICPRTQVDKRQLRSSMKPSQYFARSEMIWHYILTLSDLITPLTLLHTSSG